MDDGLEESWVVDGEGVEDEAVEGLRVEGPGEVGDSEEPEEAEDEDEAGGAAVVVVLVVLLVLLAARRSMAACRARSACARVCRKNCWSPSPSLRPSPALSTAMVT